MRAIVTVMIALCLTVGWAQDVTLPEDIDQFLGEFYDTIRTGDAEAAQSYLTPMALLQAHFAGLGKQGDVLRLGETYVLESLERKAVRCRVEDTRALVEYDLTIKGVDKKLGEDRTEVWRRMDRLARVGPGWRIAESMRLDPERAARVISPGQIKDEYMGLAAPVPEGWSASVVYGLGGVNVILDAPDLMTSISLITQDLPVSLSAKGIADAQIKAGNSMGAQTLVSSQGDTLLAGGPAYQTACKMVVGDTTLHVNHIFRVDKQGAANILYGAVFSSERAEALEKHAPQFSEVLAGLVISPRKEEPLTPDLGTIAEGKYLNPEYGVSMEIAEGWTGAISRSRFLFQVVLTPPRGESTFMLGAVDVGQWVDPKLAAHADLATHRVQAPDLKIIQEAPFNKGDVAGYQILSTLTMADGIPRTRWMLFLSRDTRIYFLLGEAVPAAEYQEWLGDWTKMLDSLTLGPVVSEE